MSLTSKKQSSSYAAYTLVTWQLARILQCQAGYIIGIHGGFKQPQFVYWFAKFNDIYSV